MILFQNNLVPGLACEQHHPMPDERLVSACRLASMHRTPQAAPSSCLCISTPSRYPLLSVSVHVCMDMCMYVRLFVYTHECGMWAQMSRTSFWSATRRREISTNPSVTLIVSEGMHHFSHNNCQNKPYYVSLSRHEYRHLCRVHMHYEYSYHRRISHNVLWGICTFTGVDSHHVTTASHCPGEQGQEQSRATASIAHS